MTKVLHSTRINIKKVVVEIDSDELTDIIAEYLRNKYLNIDETTTMDFKFMKRTPSVNRPVIDEPVMVHVTLTKDYGSKDDTDDKSPA